MIVYLSKDLLYSILSKHESGIRTNYMVTHPSCKEPCLPMSYWLLFQIIIKCNRQTRIEYFLLSKMGKKNKSPPFYQDKCQISTLTAQNNLPERMGKKAVNVKTEGSSQLFHD